MHLVTVLALLLHLTADLDAVVAIPRCSNYFYRLEGLPKIAPNAVTEDWRAKLELGVVRRQVWGFDLSLTFLFDSHVVRIRGRPVIDITLEKEVEYVALNIFNEERVRFVVTQIQPPHVSGLVSGAPASLVKVEMDYRTVCLDPPGRPANDTRGELYKFDFKLRIPRSVAEKVISTYQSRNFLSCGLVYGEKDSTFDISSLPIVVQKGKKWPWLGALFIYNLYQCTVVLISRSIALAAAHCFDQYEPAVDSVHIEVLGEKYQLFNYTLHPSYINDTSNDIAVLVLEQPIFAPNFTSICLWTSPCDPDGTSQETFIGFGKSGLNRIDLMATSDTSRNVLHFIEGNSGAALLVWNKRWHLKGISQECVNASCDVHRVTEVAQYLDWLRPYTQIDFRAALESLQDVPETSSSHLWILTGVFGALLVLLVVVYCHKRNRGTLAISELPLSPINDDAGIVLTDKKIWRFSHIEATR